MNRPLSTMLADALSGGRILSSVEVAEALGLRLTHCHRHLWRWLRSGAVRRLGGRRGRPSYWCAGQHTPRTGPPATGLAMLADGPGTATQIAERSGVRLGHALRLLRRWERAGHVSRAGAVWSLTPEAARYVRRVLGVRCRCTISVEAPVPSAWGPSTTATPTHGRCA